MARLSTLLQDALAEECRQKLVFIVGAGISADAGGPLFRDFSRTVVQANIPRELLTRGSASRPTEQMGRVATIVRPEKAMSIIRKWAGHGAANWYLLLEGKPDANHDLLAALISNGHHVLTPNLDRAIETSERFGEGLQVMVDDVDYERACAVFPSTGALWKYHGTLGSSSGNPRATVEDVSTAISEDKADAIGRLLRDHPVVVIGYSGNDHFSLQPLLGASRSTFPLYWISFARGPDEAPPTDCEFKAFDLEGRREKMEKALDEQATSGKAAGQRPRPALDSTMVAGRLAETLVGRGSDLYEAAADSSRIAHRMLNAKWEKCERRTLEEALSLEVPDPTPLQRAFIWAALLEAAGEHQAAADALPPIGDDTTEEDMSAMIQILRSATRFDEIHKRVATFRKNQNGDLPAEILIDYVNAIRVAGNQDLPSKLQFIPALTAIEREPSHPISTRMRAANQLALLRYLAVDRHTGPGAHPLESLETAIKGAEKYLKHRDVQLTEKAVSQNSLAYPRMTLGRHVKDSAILHLARAELEDATKTNQLLGHYHKLYQNWRTRSMVHQRLHELGDAEQDHRQEAIKCARHALVHSAATGSDRELETAKRTVEYSEGLRV